MKRKRILRLATLALTGFFIPQIFADDFYVTIAPVGRNGDSLVTQLRKDAIASAKLPLDKADQCNEDVLNRILWRATMGAKPYPEWAVKAVDND